MASPVTNQSGVSGRGTDDSRTQTGDGAHAIDPFEAVAERATQELVQVRGHCRRQCL
jgi:hypothetical protein